MDLITMSNEVIDKLPRLAIALDEYEEIVWIAISSQAKIPMKTIRIPTNSEPEETEDSMYIKWVDGNAPEDNIITWVEGDEPEDYNNSPDLPSKKVSNKKKKLKMTIKVLMKSDYKEEGRRRKSA